MSKLIPEARVDKNGHLVTRHVRADSPSPAAGAKIPSPVIPRGKDIEILKKQFKDFESDSYITDELIFTPDYDKLISNLENLNDHELFRFAGHMNNSPEETVAFLRTLEKGKYDLLSDMTVIFDEERHCDVDPEDEEPLDPGQIVLGIIADHEGMKDYFKSKGIEYQKLELLSPEDRRTALKWLDIKYQVKSDPTGFLDFEETKDGNGREVYYLKFANPEFIDFAIKEPRIVEIAIANGTDDVGRLREMISHETPLRGGVL